MQILHEIQQALLHLLFPHICSGCGRELFQKESAICLRCIDGLSQTNFEKYTNNPAEKIFWGRIPLMAATAQYYFTKESVFQHLIHSLKYKGDKQVGWQLGEMMGWQLKNSSRFDIDALVPLPLFPSREKKRGYNQSKILCEGISRTMNIPIMDHIIIRTTHTETQTKKGRLERWKNMEGKFLLTKPELIREKHLLLVDDVITTGATLESCGLELLKGDHVRLSIAGLCIASRI